MKNQNSKDKMSQVFSLHDACCIFSKGKKINVSLNYPAPNAGKKEKLL